MQERGLGGMVVVAADRFTPAMYYVTGQRLVHGAYFRAPDGRAHLIHDPMERDQAAAAGCPHAAFEQHGMSKLQKEERGPAAVFGRMIGEACAMMGMSGKLAFFGEMPAGFAHEMIERARQVHPAIAVDYSQPDILTAARMTKSDDEAQAIRRVSLAGVRALLKLREFLESSRRDGENFRTDGSGHITLGDLRRLLQREFLAHGLAEDGDSIVAQGRDAGVPHNRGNDADKVRAGAPIIVDIFPGEQGGGYHTDITRTLCVGPAPAALKKLYADTHDAFRAAMSALKVGEPCRSFQELTCDLYESRGHLTGRSKPGTEQGYVHGLGHGVGLSVHEGPRLGGPPSNVQPLEPRMIVSVEPGLYYPEQGMGVRIEDLVHVRPDGSIENMTPAPYELEIQPRG
jgi:Xaa-Pro aminopeptidase